MAESVAALGGKLDILVASAGITGPNVAVRDYPVDAWQQVIDVNLNGLFYCNQAAVPHLERNGYGRIVNIASVAGKEGNPNAAAYSTSKAGVIGFTKSLGKELAKTEIRVNCVTPAAVRTAIFDQMSQEHIDFMLSKIPHRPVRRDRGDRPRSSAGSRARSARSAPAPCSTSPAAAPPTSEGLRMFAWRTICMNAL